MERYSEDIELSPLGAVHRLNRKIEYDSDEISLQDKMVLETCSARCEELLLCVRPFWRSAPYRSATSEENDRIAFTNSPSNIEFLRFALMGVHGIDKCPPTKVCCLCRRKKSKFPVSNNGFEPHAIKCNGCMLIDKKLEEKEGINRQLPDSW